jgi:hypothetical protein
MARPLDIRQSIYRYALNQLFSGTGKAVDKILESINSDLSPHFRIMANGTSTVTVESVSLQNPQTSVNRAIAPVGGYIDPAFVSGTVVFPVVSGGNIVVTPGVNVPLTLPTNTVCKVLLYVDASGSLAVKPGRSAATVAAAVTPSLPNNTYSIGYVVVRNISTVIQVIPASDVYRFTGQTYSSTRLNTGFVAWATTGTHYSIATSQMTILHGGSGYINGTYVTWEGPQTTTTLTANATTYVYIDANGLIQSTTTPSASTYRNGLVLFEVLNDGTNFFVVREGHPYTLESEESRYLHDNVGTVISGTGANIVRLTSGTGTVVTDRQVKISGTAALEDHGVITTIPDSAGVAITWNYFYTNASSKWIRYAQQSQMPMVYNNAGTITALANEPAADSVGIVTFYLSKDDFDGTPLYIAVIDSTAYDTVNDAKLAITNGTFQAATNELAKLEVAKIGHTVIVNNASGGYIDEAIIKKDTLRAGGTGTTGTLGDHSALNNLLEDTHTQYALLAGRNSGQVLVGAQNASGTLILRSTANATKGKVWVDETTAASSPTVAAFVVAGGVGIGGSVQVAQDVFVAAGRKVDVAAAGSLNIGTVNATTINIGHTGATVNLYGTVTNIETVDTQIIDKLVLINKNGGATPDSSGFHVERTAGNIAIITDTALASKWKIGYSGSESEILTAGTIQTITGVKTFSNTAPVFQNTGAADNTLWMKQVTTAANNNVVYASVVNSAQTTAGLKFEVNNGTAATDLTAARPYFSWWNGSTELGRVDSSGWNFLGSSFTLPVVNTTSYPSPSNEGMIRYNTHSTVEGIEFYEGASASWQTAASRMFATAQAIVFG